MPMYKGCNFNIIEGCNGFSTRCVKYFLYIMYKKYTKAVYFDIIKYTAFVFVAEAVIDEI